MLYFSIYSDCVNLHFHYPLSFLLPNWLLKSTFCSLLSCNAYYYVLFVLHAGFIISISRTFQQVETELFKGAFQMFLLWYALLLTDSMQFAMFSAILLLQKFLQSKRIRLKNSPFCVAYVKGGKLMNEKENGSGKFKHYWLLHSPQSKPCSCNSKKLSRNTKSSATVMCKAEKVWCSHRPGITEARAPQQSAMARCWWEVTL